MSIFGFLFGLDGRVRRLHYWLGAIGLNVGYWAIMGTAIWLCKPALTTNGGDTGEGWAAALLLMLGGAVLGLVYLWCGLAIAVKRTHDRGRSGWWVLLYMLASVTVIGAVWPFIELGILDGTPGPNDYGPSPKGLGADLPPTVLT